MKMKNIFRLVVTAVLIASVVLSSLIFVHAANTINASTPEELKAAFVNVAEGGTINITNDIVMNESITKQYKPASGAGYTTRNFTITGNGKVTWTSNQGLKLDAVVVTIEGENLVLEHADTVAGSDENYILALEKTNNDAAKVTINSGTYKGFIKFVNSDKAEATNTLTINGGKFYQGNHHILGAWGKNCKLVINNGEFIGNSTNQPIVWCNNIDSTVNINGGTFRRDNTANSNLSSIMVIGESQQITIGKEDGTGPVMIHEGAADIIIYARDSVNAKTSTKILGGTFEHKGSGDIIDFSADYDFGSTFTIANGTFEQNGSGSIIKTPKRTSTGTIVVNNATFEQNNDAPMFSLSDNCTYTFGNLNITGSSEKEIFNFNGDLKVEIANSTISNKGPVIKAEDGTVELYKLGSTFTSTQGEAIVGDVVCHDGRFPRLLEMSFNSTTGNYGTATYTSLTPGATYQLDIDCRPDNPLFITPEVWIYYKQTGKNNYAKKLYASTVEDNEDGKHISFRFTLNPIAGDNLGVAAADNVQIILTATRKDTGKVWYGSASLKLVENDNVVGENILVDTKFNRCPEVLTTTKTETWSKTSNNSNFKAITIFENAQFYSELPSPNTPKMWEIGNRKTNDWGGITQEVKLTNNKFYKFELDYKAVNGASALIRVYLKPNGASSYVYENLESICNYYKLIDTGTKYILIFRVANYYQDGNNFRLYLGRNDTTGASNATAYFANISLREDISSTNGAGEKYGDNLLYNGGFEYGSFGNITSSNVNEQLLGWKQITNGQMFSTYNTVKLSEIPEDFFAYKTVLAVKEAEGSVSVLETVEAGKKYIFTYKNRYDSEEQAKPYIYAITTEGEKEITPTKITQDIGLEMNTTVYFEMPNNLVDKKNIRIGLKFDDKKISGYFTEFSLNLADQFSMPIVDENLIITEPSFENTKSIIDFNSAADESVWMKEGTFDVEPEINFVSNEYFDFLSPNVLLLAGRNVNTYNKADGLNGYAQQTVSVEANKKYQLSFNAKWVYKVRPEDKACIEITYYNGSAWQVIEPTEKKISSTEYKETYTFDVPADISAKDNLRVTIHASSAFVSGYFANFSLVEVDNDGKAISKEIMKNGDFSLKFNNWTFSNLSVYTFAEIPENYFSKVENYKQGMVQFSDSDDFAMYRYQMMLEPDTSYEVIFNHNFTSFREDNEPYGIMYFLYYSQKEDGTLEGLNTYVGEENKVPEGNNCTEEEVDDYTTRTIVRTPANIRTASTGNMYIYYYMRQGSAGYYGPCEIYKLDDAGNRITGNIMLNGDFSLGNVVWDTVKEMKALIVEQPTEKHFRKITAPTEMVTSKGTDTNATYSAEATVDAYKEYRFTGLKLDMNGEGVTPQVLYKSRRENGKYVALDADIYYDSDRFVFEIDFTIPDDAVVVDGKADIKVQITNGIKGKGYFADLQLLEMGKLVNLAGTFKASSNNYQKSKYDESVFVFYYDDKKFEDGDWSGELAAGMSGDYEEAPGEVRGTVVNKNGEPIKNMKLVLTPGNRTARTNANGEYRFTNVKPGIYQLFIETESGTRLPVQVDLEVMSSVISNIPTITCLTEAEVEMNLNADGVEPYGALRGYLYDADGKPMANVKVYIGDVGYVVTNKDGMFQFDKLPVGEFEIYSILADGSKYVFRTVEIKEFTGTSVKLSLEGDGFNWLWLLLIIPAGLVAVAAIGGTILVIVIASKKKKAKKLNN